jgi:hypothetical protein
VIDPKKIEGKKDVAFYRMDEQTDKIEPSSTSWWLLIVGWYS